MHASDILSQILQRYKVVCSKHTQSPQFIPNTKGDSFYLIREGNNSIKPTQIRISNHGTYIRSWVDRDELGDSVNRVNPAFCTNISIVFVDENKDLTDDCKGMQDCENCEIVSCKPQTFEGQDQIGRPYSIIQYVYSSKHIKRQYINGLTKAIAEASVKGEYVDPLRNIYRAAKQKEFHSSTKSQNNRQKLTESKQYNTNMNKNKIRLTESQLHRIIKESVKRILSETRFGKPQPVFGDAINGKSAYLINDTGRMVAVIDNLKFVGNAIIGGNRATDEKVTFYLTGLFGHPVDGSTLPGTRKTKDGLYITHLQMDGGDEYYELLIDDYLLTPESAAEWDYYDPRNRRDMDDDDINRFY